MLRIYVPRGLGGRRLTPPVPRPPALEQVPLSWCWDIFVIPLAESRGDPPRMRRREPLVARQDVIDHGGAQQARCCNPSGPEESTIERAPRCFGGAIRRRRSAWQCPRPNPCPPLDDWLEVMCLGCVHTSPPASRLVYSPHPLLPRRSHSPHPWPPSPANLVSRAIVVVDIVVEVFTGDFLAF